jgi:hypothetical protein
MKNYLSIYVGTPENSHEDYLFLDLVVGADEYTLESSLSLDGLSGEEFLEELEKLLNTACNLSKELKLQIKISVEELVDEADEEFLSEDTLRNVRKLVKETLSKGV